MTEAEWVNSEVVQQNGFLLEQGQGRKLQLFLCACTYRMFEVVSDGCRQRVSKMYKFFRPPEGVDAEDVWRVFRAAVEVAEKHADGLATKAQCETVGKMARAIFHHFGDIAAGGPSPDEDANYDQTAVAMGNDAAAAADCATSILPSAAERSVRVIATSQYDEGEDGDEATSASVNLHLQARQVERSFQWKMFNDIFGNPFRPAVVEPEWLTSTVVALAEGIYSDKAFDRMPILADALQDAGCDNADILTHCRGDGPHVRGCWVVDLVMGRE